MTLETDRLMSNAKIHLPGVTDAALQLEFFNVMEEFFQDTNIWTEEIDFSVSASNPASTVYYIEAESVATINRLMGIATSDGAAVTGGMLVPGEIVLANPPSQDDTYTATVALTVNDPVTRDGLPEFPQWILNKYSTGILAGLIARMMSQPAKPFTNVQLAAYNYRKFRAAVSLATNEAQHRNVNNAQAWCFPQSFAVRRR